MVTITDTTSYGEEVRSPGFDSEIKVTFSLDVSAGSKRELFKLYDKLKNNEKEADTELMKVLTKLYIKEWNLGDADGEKFEIDYDIIINKFPKRLSAWITSQIMSFTMPDKI